MKQFKVVTNSVLNEWIKKDKKKNISEKLFKKSKEDDYGFRKDMDTDIEVE